jgi:hypothetical protein
MHSAPCAPFRVRSSVLVVPPSLCAPVHARWRSTRPLRTHRPVCSAPCTLSRALECSPCRAPRSALCARCTGWGTRYVLCARWARTFHPVCPPRALRSVRPPPPRARPNALRPMHTCVGPLRSAPCTPPCVFRFMHTRSARSAPCAPSRALRSVPTVLCARPCALSVHPSRAPRPCNGQGAPLRSCTRSIPSAPRALRSVPRSVRPAPYTHHSAHPLCAGRMDTVRCVSWLCHHMVLASWWQRVISGKASL